MSVIGGGTSGISGAAWQAESDASRAGQTAIAGLLDLRTTMANRTAIRTHIGVCSRGCYSPARKPSPDLEVVMN